MKKVLVINGPGIAEAIGRVIELNPELTDQIILCSDTAEAAQLMAESDYELFNDAPSLPFHIIRAPACDATPALPDKRHDWKEEQRHRPKPYKLKRRSGRR